MPWTERRPSKSNPRRPPAHLSVSLRRTSAETATYRSEAQRVKSKDGFTYIEGSRRLPILDDTSDGSPSSLQRFNGTDGSGESSNADEWFFQSSNDGREKVKSFADTDPPFFIRESSSSDSLLEDQERQCSRQGSTSGPTRQSRLLKGLFQLENGRNTTKDFRSIIDDLTIENKKFKRRLKRYIKLHDTHNSSNDQKLFEVRVHNLVVEEKRKLEEILLGFVRNLPYREEELEPWGNGSECTGPSLNYHKGESSQASPRIGDSAYASMSASGLDPSTPPCHCSGHDEITQPAKRQKNHGQHSTEGLLLPLGPTTMVERAKKRLVVRRLEQIFAGEDSLISAHHQALQKKDMLQTAERTNDSEVRGKRTDTEVTRDARIMSKDTEDTSNPVTQKEPKVSADSKHQAADIVDKHNLARNLSNGSFKEQRPTKPLDLDPIRA